MNNNKYKLIGLAEEEKELAAEFMENSDYFKVVLTTLSRLVKLREEALTERSFSLKKDDQTKDLIQTKLEIQGMKILLKDFSNLRSSSDS